MSLKIFKKHIASFFLFLAAGTLLAHNVIPHHHHFEDSFQKQVCQISCEDDHGEENHHGAEFHAHEHETNHQECSECHFNLNLVSYSYSVPVDVEYQLISEFRIDVEEYSTTLLSDQRLYLCLFRYGPGSSSRGPPSFV